MTREREPLDDLEAEPFAAELLAVAASAAPSPALRARLLAAAAASRRPGRPVVHVEEITPLEALRRTHRCMAELVDSISVQEATALTIEGWTVAGLIGHLTAIERYFGSVLGWWDDPAPHDVTDHLTMTRPAVAIAEAADFEEVRMRWHDATGAVEGRLVELEGRLSERVDFHSFDLSVRSLLVARTFEVWTHDEDIRRALGREPEAPDPARLRVMTQSAVAALPIGMALIDRPPAGRAVRVVLTGDGGGSWLQPLEFGADTVAVGAPAPSATLLTDAVSFCRVAARRLAPRDLDHRVQGDASLIDDVLAAVAVFAA